MSASETATKSWIEKTPGVCGGDARIRNTRHTVAGLVEWKKLEMSDAELQGMFIPPLTQADLDAAWQYYSDHRQEIDQSIWENKASMIECAGAPAGEASGGNGTSWILKSSELNGCAGIRTTPIPVSMLVYARRLGMTDERIRNAFHPALSQADLDAAWKHYEQNREDLDREVEREEGA